MPPENTNSDLTILHSHSPNAYQQKKMVEMIPRTPITTNGCITKEQQRQIYGSLTINVGSLCVCVYY